MCGIHWTPKRFLREGFNREDEKRKQQFLGDEGDEGAPEPVNVEVEETNGSEYDRFMQFIPEDVGKWQS